MRAFPERHQFAASGIPGPEQRRVWRRTTGNGHSNSPLFGVLGFPERSPRRPIQPSAHRECVTINASCRALPFTRTAPGSPKRTRIRSTPDAPTPNDFRTRDAFHRQVPSAPPYASAERCLMGRHWYLRFAASIQLRACVHAWLSRARPVCPGCYTKTLGPLAPHRLLQLKRSTSTPTTIQTLLLWCDEQARRAAGSLFPCGTTPTEVFQVRGYTVMKPLACNPHPDDRSPKWIFPNLYFLGHLLSPVNSRLRLEIQR